MTQTQTEEQPGELDPVKSGERWERLQELEEQLDTGARGVIEAMTEIRESRLYIDAGFETFEGYCNDRWKWTRQHVNRLIVWAKTAAALEPNGSTELKESHARELAGLAEEIQSEIWKQAVDTAPDGKVTAKHVRATRERVLGKKSPVTTEAEEKAKERRENARNALLSSNSNEWYTPPYLTDAAREVMGNIDLDPASCNEANEWIKAGTIYTIEDDGLTQKWFGRVWLNMPYGLDEWNRSNQKVWTSRLILEQTARDVKEGCMLTGVATGARWFQPLWQWPICFLEGRTKFEPPADTEKKDQPTQYSCVTYIGPVEKWAEFKRVFDELGHVVMPEWDLEEPGIFTPPEWMLPHLLVAPGSATYTPSGSGEEE